MANKRALITGIYGQDGSYLLELLLEKGYEVHGIEREPLTDAARVICEYLEKKGVFPHVTHRCDLNFYPKVRDLMGRVQPDECYHLAAAHYSSELSDPGRKVMDRDLFYNNVWSTLNLISAINEVSPHTRLVLAGSCLMFEESEQSPQNEQTPHAARSMYGLFPKGIQPSSVGCDLVQSRISEKTGNVHLKEDSEQSGKGQAK
jgi:GDPmannose 4,6-dehydratase